jgi:hypothetical protein
MKIFPLKPMSPLDNMQALLKVMSEAPKKYPKVNPPVQKQVPQSSLVKYFNIMKEKGISVCSKLWP